MRSHSACLCNEYLSPEAFCPSSLNSRKVGQTFCNYLRKQCCHWTISIHHPIQKAYTKHIFLILSTHPYKGTWIQAAIMKHQIFRNDKLELWMGEAFSHLLQVPSECSVIYTQVTDCNQYSDEQSMQMILCRSLRIIESLYNGHMQACKLHRATMKIALPNPPPHTWGKPEHKKISVIRHSF